MTTSPLNRIKLLIVCVFAAGGLLLALSASSAHAQGNSAIDQYLEQNPDGGAYHGPKQGGSKGGSGGSGGSSSSSGGSSGSGSGGNSSSDGDAATKDYNGHGTIDDQDDKTAAEKKKQKKDKKKDDDKSDAIAGAGDGGGTGGSSSSAKLANQTVPAEDDGGSWARS